MSGEAEAAGDVLTGAIVGTALEGAAGKSDPAEHGKCLNCGAETTDAYCSACGQRVHLHRSLVHLGHDILHGVFHFEGKMWRTLPELFFHPGRLTRRYIDGERAKFVSPMALYLSTVLLMFGVFSFTTGSRVADATQDGVAGEVITEFKDNDQSAREVTQERIEALEEKLKEGGLSDDKRIEAERNLSDLRSAQAVMDALAKGDWDALKGTDVNFGWPALQQRLEHGAKEFKDNPTLAFYRIKVASYKYSWALIPLSVPFMWLLFFWRRDIHLYDHAIFITYSISFMMMFLIVLTLASAFGVSGGIWGTALGIVPPLHLYKQLRYAYNLSRFGAVLRLFLLSIGISIVLTIFSVLLLLLGMLG